MAEIDKKLLEHLAELARLELDTSKEEKMVSDLESVLGHFKELEEVNTENIVPRAGGTDNKNVMRDDDEVKAPLEGDKAREALPEKERGFLKVPPVFE